MKQPQDEIVINRVMRNVNSRCVIDCQQCRRRKGINYKILISRYISTSLHPWDKKGICRKIMAIVKHHKNMGIV